MFNKIKKMEDPHQIIFAILISFAVISFWRGLWGLMDLYLFPGNLELSFWISTIFGIAILIMTNYIVKELI